MSDLARFRWRARRGTKELDIVLDRFLMRSFASLSAGERTCLDRLLDEEDDRLAAWLLFGTEAPHDDDIARLVQRIRHDAGV